MRTDPRMANMDQGMIDIVKSYAGWIHGVKDP